MKYILSFVLSICILSSVFSQNQPLTIAESSDFQSTSTYSDVMKFISTVSKTSKNIRMDTLAISTEGKVIPLIVIGNPLPRNLEEIRKSGKIAVYIQANIHAGEVEGKEASLMLVRELLKPGNADYLRNLVILICPILNPDGNDQISVKNRTNQNGPKNGVGVRYNGQMLDLNRDAIKLETPEIKGVLTNIFNKWDPAITVDCHTTNGSYHKEPVTFTWMMNPNGDRGLINFMRDTMMPAVSKTLKSKYNVENLFYGEFVEMADYSKGWISYASEPRYLVNYVGIRNRLAILNENYVYADYKTRVLGCYHLLWSILDFASVNYKSISNQILRADYEMITYNERNETDSFAVTYEGSPTPLPITIQAYEADSVPGATTWPYFKNSYREKTVTVPYIADYYATKSIKMPVAYLITVKDQKIIENLKTHGILMTKLKDSMTLDVEKFVITELKPTERLNQGHYTNNIKGKFLVEKHFFEKGTIMVECCQPLGKLAAYLLEPQSDDGLLLWNFFDKYLVPQWGRGFYPYPVYRVLSL